MLRPVRRRRGTPRPPLATDGLVMLSTVAKTKAQRAAYLTEAEDILGSLSTHYLAPSSGEAVLTDGSDNVPGNYEINTALIFGDYYFTEALLRLQDALEGKPGWALYDSLGTPEPSTWAMMLLGFAGLGYAGYRRARKGSASIVAAYASFSLTSAAKSATAAPRSTV